MVLLWKLQQLKLLFISKYNPGKLTLPIDPHCYESLEQLCIDDHTFNVHSALVDALVYNKKLSHLFLGVGDISRDNICKICYGLPRLVALHLYVDAAIARGHDKHSLLRELKTLAVQRRIDNYACMLHLARTGRREATDCLNRTILSSDMRPLWEF